MAESILFDFAANIMTKLGSFATRELGLLCGVHDELNKLKDKLSPIKAVLLDAEKQQVKRDDVKNWIARLKDAFYEIDDLIDEFSYETLRRQVMAKDGKKAKEVRIFFSKSNQIAFRLKMCHKIKEIKESLKAIDDDKNQFRFLELRVDHTRDDGLRKTRETYSFIPEGEMMGRDDDEKAIINLLLDATVKDDIAVIAIVGMGGLGKTTLIQSIYRNEKITKHFELKSWVCVSEEFDIEIIIQKVIESITKEKPKSLTMEALQQILREKINGKKYLLVMDDIWNKDYKKWDCLKKLLMGGARGSRIVITTRDEQVATTCDATSKYPLGKLDEKNSWLLFEKMALGGEKVEEQALVDIGKEIVAILKGVPLAIRTIGRHLNVKKLESYWLSFKENELNRVMQLENEIQSILELSYNHLSSNLKQCFVYCALFPKDHEIQKDEVIRQWVAQGFIQPHDAKAIEDVGEDYFLELLWGSFFQDITKNEMGDIEHCKMHDLMHDLASSIAKNEGVLRSMGDKQFDRRTRHVSFDLNPYERFTHPKSLIEAKNLRTLYVPYDRDDGSVYKIVPNNLRLRTLVIWCSNGEVLLKFTSKLKHLRYLDLSMLSMKFLPNSITELYSLETLILSKCYGLRELPRDTKNWIKLRHLNMFSCPELTHMPKGLGGLTSLQTMNLFVLGEKSESGLSELNELNNLRGLLSIEGLRHHKFVGLPQNAKFLDQKRGIQSLTLDWRGKNYENIFKRDGFDYDEKVLECLEPHSNVKEIEIVCYEGVKLCSWVSSTSLASLVKMNLSHSRRLQHLPQFDQFPHLKYLHLQGLDCIEYIHDNNNDYLSSSTFFPCLERLEIAFMRKLKGWWQDELSLESSQKSSSSSVSFPTILPCLSVLDIFSCPNLFSLPERMCNLHSLQTLSIVDCPKLEERCKKEIGEDWPKIAHVQDLRIGWN